MVRHQAEKVGSFILEVACQTNRLTNVHAHDHVHTHGQRRAIFIYQSPSNKV